MIKPRALKFGDTIGVIAPASPTSKKRADAAKRALEDLGFNVKMGKTCYEEYGYLAGSDIDRAEDINSMFDDKSVDGIICLRGGYGTTKILHLIDYNVIRNNPKVFVGYSDITAIHTAIQNNCNLITFHGPMVDSDIGHEFDDFSKDYLIRAIMKPEPLGLIQNPEEEEITCFVEGKAEGEIVGGNLSLIAATIGTPYEIDTRGRILLMEDVDEEPYSIDRMLTQLLSAGKLHDAAGIVLGDWSRCDAKDPKKSLTLMEVFRDIIKPVNKPTIYNLKAGHCTPKVTIPFGTRALLNANECELIILEGAVIL